MRGALRCHWVYLFKVMVERGSSPGALLHMQCSGASALSL